MSIADKITSIEGHLTADYEGLENIGADLTNIDKNIYNIRTCLDTIYSNLPKTTGEGSNLSLNTLKGRINVDDILGDTSQLTTTGKNNLNTSSITTYTHNGITYTPIYENGLLQYINVNGTASAVSYIDIGYGSFATGTYTITGSPASRKRR
jgi:hypothetical protein